MSSHNNTSEVDARPKDNCKCGGQWKHQFDKYSYRDGQTGARFYNCGTCGAGLILLISELDSLRLYQDYLELKLADLTCQYARTSARIFTLLKVSESIT